MKPVAETKRADRAAAMARRAAAHGAGAGAARRAAGHLIGALAPLRDVDVVSAYLGIGDELDPRPAMLALVGLGYRVCVPVVVAKGEPLRFREWTPGCTLVSAPFGLSVPEGGDWLVPQALVVPLLAFDRTGQRLGYGGGFYDRTLEALRRDNPVHAFGFAYAGQEVEHVPVEPFDAPLDAIVTENGVIAPATP